MDTVALSRAGVTFEALILEQVLEPVAGQNSLASCGLMAVAQAIAEKDAGGFGRLLESQLVRRGG
jgi:hypothetical protein